MRLTWRTNNAERVSLQPLGSVALSDSTTVTPRQSTEYRLIVDGRGGLFPGKLFRSQARVVIDRTLHRLEVFQYRHADLTDRFSVIRILDDPRLLVIAGNRFCQATQILVVQETICKLSALLTCKFFNFLLGKSGMLIEFGLFF